MQTFDNADQSMNRLVFAGLVVPALILALLGFGVTWNEARKEILFLCSNFGPGTTEQSVIKQLDTGSFLRYRKETLFGKNRIYVDTAINFGLYRCVIELDRNQLVIEANID